MPVVQYPGVQIPWFPLTQDFDTPSIYYDTGAQIDRGDPDPDPSVVCSLVMEPWFPLAPDINATVPEVWYRTGDQLDTSDPDPQPWQTIPMEPWFELAPDVNATIPEIWYRTGDQLDESDPDPDPFDYDFSPPDIDDTHRFIAVYDFRTGDQLDRSDPSPGVTDGTETIALTPEVLGLLSELDFSDAFFLDDVTVSFDQPFDPPHITPTPPTGFSIDQKITVGHILSTDVNYTSTNVGESIGVH